MFDNQQIFIFKRDHTTYCILKNINMSINKHVLITSITKKNS